jgi:hypothetical protein
VLTAIRRAAEGQVADPIGYITALLRTRSEGAGCQPPRSGEDGDGVAASPPFPPEVNGAVPRVVWAKVLETMDIGDRRFPDLPQAIVALLREGVPPEAIYTGAADIRRHGVEQMRTAGYLIAAARKRHQRGQCAAVSQPRVPPIAPPLSIASPNAGPEAAVSSRLRDQRSLAQPHQKENVMDRTRQAAQAKDPAGHQATAGAAARRGRSSPDLDLFRAHEEYEAMRVVLGAIHEVAPGDWQNDARRELALFIVAVAQGRRQDTLATTTPVTLDGAALQLRVALEWRDRRRPDPAWAHVERAMEGLARLQDGVEPQLRLRSIPPATPSPGPAPASNGGHEPRAADAGASGAAGGGRARAGRRAGTGRAK